MLHYGWVLVSRRICMLIALSVIAVLAGGCSGESLVVVDDVTVDDAATRGEVAADADDGAGDETVATDATVDESAADPAPTGVRVRSREQQSASEQSQTYLSIRDVDFMNGFSYDSDLDFGPDTITVVDGSYENGEWGDDNYFWFGATQVEIGDIDGDGVEDAIVATSWNGGGTGFFDSVTAYRLRDGHVASAGRVHFGDRADGGIFDVRIEEGIAQVWSFSTTLGACCPTEVTRNNLLLDEHVLIVADREPTQSWMSLNSYDELQELKFLPGTSSAVIAVYGWEINGGFTFEARRGQLLTLGLAAGPAPANVSVTDLSTGQITSGLTEMSLLSDSLYTVNVGFDAERSDTTTLDFAINNAGG